MWILNVKIRLHDDKQNNIQYCDKEMDYEAVTKGTADYLKIKPIYKEISEQKSVTFLRGLQWFLFEKNWNSIK